MRDTALGRTYLNRLYGLTYQYQAFAGSSTFSWEGWCFRSRTLRENALSKCSISALLNRNVFALSTKDSSQINRNPKSSPWKYWCPNCNWRPRWAVKECGLVEPFTRWEVWPKLIPLSRQDSCVDSPSSSSMNAWEPSLKTVSQLERVVTLNSAAIEDWPSMTSPFGNTWFRHCLFRRWERLPTSAPLNRPLLNFLPWNRGSPVWVYLFWKLCEDSNLASAEIALASARVSEAMPGLRHSDYGWGSVRSVARTELSCRRSAGRLSLSERQSLCGGSWGGYADPQASTWLRHRGRPPTRSRRVWCRDERPHSLGCYRGASDGRRRADSRSLCKFPRRLPTLLGNLLAKQDGCWIQPYPSAHYHFTCYFIRTQ